MTNDSLGTLRGAFLILKTRTISSAVEHPPHKRNVIGSIPIWFNKIYKTGYENAETNDIVMTVREKKPKGDGKNV